MAKDCSQLAQTISDLATNIMSEPNVKNIDDVVTEMKKDIPGITRDMVTESIIEVSEGKKRVVDDITKKVNAIRREPFIERNTRRKISQLNEILKAGKTITPKQRANRATKAIQLVRDIRDDLKKKIATSEPAVKKRLQKQIADLTERIESGDIQPKERVVQVPQSKQLERLQFERDQLQKQIRQEISSLKPKTVFDRVVGFFDISRDLTLSYDQGAVFRQGGFFLLGKPVASRKAFGAMAKATLSERGLAKVDKEINDNPDMPLFVKSGGFIAPTDGTHKPNKREEAHRSSWASKNIPGIRMSERGYVSFLNKMRIDVFSALLKTMTKNGEATQGEAKALANLVNIATGRGDFGRFAGIAEGLSIPFLAPRYVLSRFQLLLGQPLFQKDAGRTRKLIAAEYGKYLIGVALIYSLLAMIGDIFDEEVEFEANPTSTDFGKGKIGNTRLDLLSGLSQPTVLLSRLVSGQLKSSTTGRISRIRGEDKVFGSGVPSVAGRFLRYKLSPLLGQPFNIIAGEDPIGRPVTPTSAVLNFVTPLSFRDIKESIEEQGVPTGTALSLMAIFGAGVQTYGSQVQDEKKTKRSKAFKSKK